MAETTPYHHGDLRAALIGAAQATLIKDGLGALSLRGVARDAGVSAMAPYHHFRDRSALLAAVAAAGFERLHSEKLAALPASAEDPVVRLVAWVRGYIAFVIANPELYRLMTSAELADRADHPDLDAAAAAPAASLAALVAAARAAGRVGRADERSVAAQLWAFSHGLANLAIDGHVAVSAKDTLRLAESGARAMLLGYSVAL